MAAPYKRNRPTVGVLPGWQAYEGSLNSFLVLAFRSLRAAARERDCNLLIACGVSQVAPQVQGQPAWPVLSPDCSFVPVGPWNTDGLLVIPPLLSEERSSQLQDMRATGHPIVFLGAGEAGPMVDVENATGVRLGIQHLHEHGHERIAFIASYENDPEYAGNRLVAYKAAIRELGLPVDPELVAYGRHSEWFGYLATRQLLERKVRFTALMASNDSSAFGSLRALHEAGRRVPEDVAVIGFDDRPECMAQLPPLSSVRYPLEDASRHAIDLLLGYVQGREHGIRQISVPAKLIVRQSCGCLAGVSADPPLGARTATRKQAVRSQTVQAMAEAVQAADVMTLDTTELLAEPLSAGEVVELCRPLLDAFLRGIQQRQPEYFRTGLANLLRRVDIADDDPQAWQAAIVVLERQLPLYGLTGRQRSMAQAMLREAHVIVSESVRTRHARHAFNHRTMHDQSSRVMARILAALDESQVVDTLQEYLPWLGIRHAVVAAYEAEGDDPVAWATAIMGTARAQRRFPARSFPPDGLYPPELPYSLALLPVTFDEGRTGFMAFEGEDMNLYAAVVSQVTAALRSARLYDQVRKLSLTDSLTGLHNLRYFELVLEIEVERSQRFGRPLSVVMLDLDHFKDFNDALGHLPGNEALRRVATCLLQTCRGVDTVVRYGGEEFALILPETDAAGAAAVGEKILQAVASLPLPRPLTISAGVAAAEGPGADATRLVDQADQALYQAKHAGRGRVFVYPHQGGGGLGDS